MILIHDTIINYKIISHRFLYLRIFYYLGEFSLSFYNNIAYNKLSIIMASLKDKLKSKIKNKGENHKMQFFDQSMLNVELLQGQNQLQELNILCSWNQNNKVSAKPPRLSCKWYNRTQNNYQEIQGVSDQHYQPSILDIDSMYKCWDVELK